MMREVWQKILVAARRPRETPDRRHVKPYRLHHLTSLAALVLLCFGLVSGMTGYWFANYSRRQAAVLSVQQSDAIRVPQSTVTVHSTQGFSLTYDQSAFSAEAGVLEKDGKLATYGDADINVSRPYTAVEISPSHRLSLATTSHLSVSVGAEDMKALARQYGLLDEAHLLQKHNEEHSTAAFSVMKNDETKEVINGVEFVRQSYTVAPLLTDRGALQFAPSQTIVYTAYHNQQAVVMKLSGLGGGEAAAKPYDSIIRSFQLLAVSDQSRLPDIDPVDAAQVLSARGRSRSLVDTLLNTEVASAGADELSTQRMVTVSRYAPATVRVYHLICGDIRYHGQTLDNVCDGGTGTGFFVSSDGYVATSGHVVATSAQDIVAHSLSYNLDILKKMLAIEGYSATDIAQLTAQLNQNEQNLTSITAAIYNLPKGLLEITRPKEFYLVALGSEEPDLKAIVKNGQAGDLPATVRVADLVGIDYDFEDIAKQEFKHSDVALLKLSGSNYPVVRLGSIDTLLKGSALTVIGFPGSADNPLTSDSHLETSATSGIVSAIRTTGGHKRLVQSDVKIGHGNSGGPTFDEDGKVFGLATYVYAGDTTGDSDITYVRDIQDLLDLAKSSSVKLQPASQVQMLWDKGLTEFFGAHYKASIKTFAQVQRLYPAHTLAAEFTAIAKVKIKNGEEARSSLNLAILSAGLLAALVAIVYVCLLIMRHHAKHLEYKLGQMAAIVPETVAEGLLRASGVLTGEHLKVVHEAVPVANEVPSQSPAAEAWRSLTPASASRATAHDPALSPEWPKDSGPAPPAPAKPEREHAPHLPRIRRIHHRREHR